VPDFQDKYDQDLVPDLVHDSVLPHPDPEGAIVPFQLLYSGRTRLLLQFLEATYNPLLDGAIQFSELAFRRRRKLDGI